MPLISNPAKSNWGHASLSRMTKASPTLHREAVGASGGIKRLPIWHHALRRLNDERGHDFGLQQVDHVGFR